MLSLRTCLATAMLGAACLTGLGPLACAAGEAAPLPATEFIRQAQKPLLADAWCKLRGEVRFRAPGERATIPIRVSLRLQPESMRAEIILGISTVYSVRQTYAQDGALPEIKLGWPDDKPKFSLEKLGLHPEDLTFSFLFWQFSRELDGESVRGQACRVMEFLHPQTGERVHAWMASDFGFPLRVHWFRKNENVFYRGFEFTEFKRQDELWFPKGLRLSGENWRGQITFLEEADAALVKDKAPPPNLFLPQTPPGAPRK